MGEWRLAPILLSLLSHKGCTLILVSNCQRTTLPATRAPTAPHWFARLVLYMHIHSARCTLHSAHLTTSDESTMIKRADRVDMGLRIADLKPLAKSTLGTSNARLKNNL
jgi:hypothetical protein